MDVTILEAYKIIQKGHFRYNDGTHGDTYLDHHAMSYIAELLCMNIAAECQGISTIDTIAGIQPYGFLYAYQTARLMERRQAAKRRQNGENQEYQIKNIFAEKVGPDTKELCFRTKFLPDIEGKKVLIIDDVANSGGSLIRLRDALQDHGGIVVGAAVFCNRKGKTAEDLGSERFISLIDISLESWPADECPLCADGIPLSDTLGYGGSKYALKSR